MKGKGKGSQITKKFVRTESRLKRDSHIGLFKVRLHKNKNKELGCRQEDLVYISQL